jgi:hypothetical protein
VNTFVTRNNLWCVWVVILLLWIFSASCSFPVASGESALTKEADKLAREYWNSGLTKCGDYYYGRTRRKIVPYADEVLLQYKDLVFETKPGKVTEADKLNGIEWKGSSYLTPAAYRVYSYKSKEWEQWRNGAPIGVSTYANLIKQRGEWSVGENIFKEMRHNKIDCKDIPD